MSKLTAESLKNMLWETLQQVKSGVLPPQHGHAISSQAREILKTVNVQLRVGDSHGSNVPKEVKEFVEESN